MNWKRRSWIYEVELDFIYFIILTLQCCNFCCATCLGKNLFEHQFFKHEIHEIWLTKRRRNIVLCQNTFLSLIWWLIYNDKIELKFMEFTVIVCWLNCIYKKIIVKVGLCRVRIKLVVYSFCTLYHALFTSIEK